MPGAPRPSPALLARRVRPAELPVQRAQAPATVRFERLISLGPGEVAERLALSLTDGAVLSGAEELVGGPDAWAALRDDVAREWTVGTAWKHTLDVTRAEPIVPAGGRIAPEAFLAVLIFTHAALGGTHAIVRRSLQAQAMGWQGTYREVNIRLAGQLYQYALAATRREDADRCAFAFRAALHCWDVVERMSGDNVPERLRLTADQVQVWRGMRGVTRLFFARREANLGELLSGAVADLIAAEANGDGSTEHFLMLAEAQLRSFRATQEEHHLADACATLDRAGDAGVGEWAEVAVLRGDLAFAGGLRTMRATGMPEAELGPEEPGGDPVDAALLAGDPGERPARELDPALLDRALGEFEAAAALYAGAMALPRNGRADPAVWRTREGQALLRAAHVLRLLRRPYHPHLSRSLERLRDCADENHPVCTDYLAWALLEFAKLHLRIEEHRDSRAAADAADEGLRYLDSRLPETVELRGRLEALRAEARVRLAQAFDDPVALGDAIADALILDEGSGIAATPIIYGCRRLLEPYQPDGNAGRACADPAWRDLVILITRRVVTWLEAYYQRCDGQVARRYSAGHAAGLLTILRATGLVPASDPDVSLWRIYELQRVAANAGSPNDLTSPVMLMRWGRTAIAYARETAAAEDPDGSMRLRAIELYDEGIQALHAAYRVSEPRWVSGAESAGADDVPEVEEVPPVSDDDAALQETGGVGVPEKRALASRLGEGYLRRDALRRRDSDIEASIRWFEISIAAGNAEPEVLSLLGDAYGRRGRRSGKKADLRQALDLKRKARAALRDGDAPPARESWSVSAAFAQILWEQGDETSYTAAATFALTAAVAAPAWPWPWLQLADLAEAPPSARASLPHLPPVVSGVADAWKAVREGDTRFLLARAVRLAVDSDEFRQTVLGGTGPGARGKPTYVLDDPHGLLSATLVLTPRRLGSAEGEQARLAEFGAWLRSHERLPWAQAIEPMGVVNDPATGLSISVTRRATGQQFAELIAQWLLSDEPGETARQRIGRVTDRCVRFLACMQGWRGPARTGHDPGDNLRKQLWDHLHGLGVNDGRRLAFAWLDSVPDELPWIGNRDAHTENWLVDRHDRIVAVDLQGRGWHPLGLELVQLLEDLPLLPLDDHGITARRRLGETYLAELPSWRPDLAGALPAVDDPVWWRAYACFAARRAVFLIFHQGRPSKHGPLAASGELARLRVAHAYDLLAWAATVEPSLAPLERAVRLARRRR